MIAHARPPLVEVALAQTARAFWHPLVARRGYRDGLRGIFLAGFWASYDSAATWALWRRGR